MNENNYQVPINFGNGPNFLDLAVQLEGYDIANTIQARVTKEKLYQDICGLNHIVKRKTTQIKGIESKLTDTPFLTHIE